LRFAFIAQHRAEFEIKIMCQVLEVSQSGYYAWRQRPESSQARANRALSQHIQAIHVHSRSTYGVRRVHAALMQQQVMCGKHRVARLMRAAGLRGKGRARHRPSTTHSDPTRTVVANILNRDFTAARPNQKWLADITYIDTLEGFLYLAGILDVFSRRVVGWAMAEHMREDLVEAALRLALAQRQPSRNLLHHSDQGSQYTSDHYRALLAQHHITLSLSHSGDCYDNAMMESLWGTLKAECATAPFPSRAAARLAIFDYLEVWYNRQRLHSALGYTSPASFERQRARPFP
jgi:transposase InsO family protein